MVTPRIVEALMDARAYRLEGGASVEIQLVETHISWLFLTGEYVYKVKKPVNLGFVDFTSLDKRWFYCHEELNLNRRISPETYLDVVDVCEHDGALSIGGPGLVVDHAVKMRQLPRDRMLDALLARGEVSEADIRAIAERVAAFHASLPPVPRAEALASVDALEARIAENSSETERFVGMHLDDATHRDLRAYSTEAMDALRPMLERRAREGRVVDGHGDLHAQQICLMADGIAFIDCAEFNPSYRIGDVALEVAFLAMDLDHAGRRDLSEAFISTYAEATGDHELGPLLPLLKSYRAYVRGKVTSYRTMTMELSDAEAQDVAQAAGSYYRLARSYALASLPSPTLYVVMGLSGTGKSTFSRALANQWGVAWAPADVVRKGLAGLLPDERGGQDLYTHEMDERTYGRLRETASEALREGRSFVMDATFRDPAQRAAVVRLAEDAGAAVRVLLCEAPPEVVRQRLGAREAAGGDPSDATWAVYQGQAEGWTTPTEFGDALVRVDMDRPVEQALDQALREIYRRALA